MWGHMSMICFVKIHPRTGQLLPADNPTSKGPIGVVIATDGPYISGWVWIWKPKAGTVRVATWIGGIWVPRSDNTIIRELKIENMFEWRCGPTIEDCFGGWGKEAKEKIIAYGKSQLDEITK